eukprot:2635092-Rhodomonas_salina.4
MLAGQGSPQAGQVESPIVAHGPCSDPQLRLASYQPDAIVEFEKDLQKYLVLVEFTCSFDKTLEVHKSKIAEKRQARGIPGCHAAPPVPATGLHCHATDIRDELSWSDHGPRVTGRRATKLKCLEACIIGNHELANVRRACIQERRGREGNERPPGPPTRGPRTASRPVG